MLVNFCSFFSCSSIFYYSGLSQQHRRVEGKLFFFHCSFWMTQMEPTGISCLLWNLQQDPGKTGRSQWRVKILTKVSNLGTLSVCPIERKVKNFSSFPFQIQISMRKTTEKDRWIVLIPFCRYGLPCRIIPLRCEQFLLVSLAPRVWW